MRKLSVFGATGTIGDNTLDLVGRHPDKFEIEVLTAHENVEKLAHWRVHKPSLVVVSDPECRPGLASALSDLPIKVEAGAQALVDAACVPVDLVVMGIVGFAALGPSLAAVRYADAVALANKECLVVSGAMLMETAARTQRGSCRLTASIMAFFNCWTDATVTHPQKLSHGIRRSVS